MAEVYADLWRRIDELRGKMSIRELAEISGIPEPSLQTTRLVKTLPKLQMLYPISKALGTTIEYLYAGEKPDYEDDVVFRKLASSQDLMDIATRLTVADNVEIQMVRRLLCIDNQGGVSSSTMASGIA